MVHSCSPGSCAGHNVRRQRLPFNQDLVRRPRRRILIGLAVHGPDGKDRRGQIWGKQVPYGLTNLGFGNGQAGSVAGGSQ